MELTTKDAAQMLEVTTRRVIQLVMEGKIIGEKRGRDWQIQKASVERYMIDREKKVK